MQDGILKTLLLIISLCAGTVYNASETPRYAVVVGETVHVRENAGAGYHSVSRLQQGHLVSLLQRQGIWRKLAYVKDNQQQQGWMAEKYLLPVSADKLGVVNANAVKVRRGAGSGYQSIAQLNKGDEVLLLQRGRSWSRVMYHQNATAFKQGWLYNDYLSQQQASSQDLFEFSRFTAPIALRELVTLAVQDRSMTCGYDLSSVIDSCELEILFSVVATNNVQKIQVQCDALLTLDVLQGDLIKFPIRQEKIFYVSADRPIYSLSTQFSPTNPDLVNEVNVLSLRCAVLSYLLR